MAVFWMSSEATGYLVVSFLEVEFRKYSLTVNPQGEVGDVRERISIRDSNCIQLLITATGPLNSVPLIDHVKRRSPGKGRVADYACLLHGGEFSFGGSQLVGVQAVRFGKNWRARVGEKMEAVKLSKERTSGNSRSRLEIHFGVERRAARREGDVGGVEVNMMAGEPGEELLTTFW